MSIIVPFRLPSVYEQIQSISEPLVVCLKEHDSSITEETFRQRVVAPLRDAGPDAVIGFLTQLKSSQPDDPLDRRFAPILMSVGLCVLAADAHEKNLGDLAVGLLLEAKYWCGAATATRGIIQAYKRTVLEVVQRKQSDAGRANNADVRAEVEKAVLEQFGDKPGQFDVRQMAEQLQERLVKFASEKSKGRSLSGQFPVEAIMKLIKANSVTGSLAKKSTVGRPKKG